MPTQPTLQSLQEENQQLREELLSLKIRLDESPHHTPVTRMRKSNPRKALNVKLLAGYCEQHGIPVLRLYNSYGKGNYNYPNSVWKAVYPRLNIPLLPM